MALLKDAPVTFKGRPVFQRPVETRRIGKSFAIGFPFRYTSTDSPFSTASKYFFAWFRSSVNVAISISYPLEHHHNVHIPVLSNTNGIATSRSSNACRRDYAAFELSAEDSARRDPDFLAGPSADRRPAIPILTVSDADIVSHAASAFSSRTLAMNLQHE
jgi:hypothetical protein